MPGHQILLPYCATGVKTDIETLLSRFTETQSVRYEEFAKVWREMQMPLIFYGRQDMRDLWLFVEELFSIALNYVLPPYSFQVRVGGLYIMYGLFFKQPNDPKIKFRVTQQTWKTLIEFIEEAQSQSHLDVVYVFLKLRHSGAFHFTVTPGQFDPLLKETTDGEDQNTLADEDAFSHNLLGDLFDSSNVAHLAEVHDQYHRLKCVLAGPKSTKPDPDIDMIHSNLVHNITKIVASYEEFKKTGKKPKRKRRDSGGVTTSESEGDSDSEMPCSSRTRSQGSIRQEIKARAFSGTPERTRDRRHRVLNSEASSSPSPQKTSRQEVHDEEEAPMSSDLRSHLRSAILNMPASFEEINTDANLLISPCLSPRKGRKRHRRSSESVDRATRNTQHNDTSVSKRDLEKTKKIKTKRNDVAKQERSDSSDSEKMLLQSESEESPSYKKKSKQTIRTKVKAKKSLNNESKQTKKKVNSEKSLSDESKGKKLTETKKLDKSPPEKSKSEQVHQTIQENPSNNRGHRRKQESPRKR